MAKTKRTNKTTKKASKKMVAIEDETIENIVNSSEEVISEVSSVVEQETVEPIKEDSDEVINAGPAEISVEENVVYVINQEASKQEEVSVENKSKNLENLIKKDHQKKSNLQSILKNKVNKPTKVDQLKQDIRDGKVIRVNVGHGWEWKRVDELI